MRGLNTQSAYLRRNGRFTVAFLWLVVVLLMGCKEGETTEDDARRVPECEQYFRRADQCFERNPLIKVQMAETVKEVKAKLKENPSQPLERQKMIDLCKANMSQLEQACH